MRSEQRAMRILTALLVLAPASGAWASLGFVDYVSPRFLNNDSSGQSQNYHEFLRSIQSDFKNLDQIQLAVNSQSVQAAGERSVISLNWNFRARFRRTGEEWILENQKSRLSYEWSEEDQRWLLVSISGDPIFGLSNQLGALPVYRGKVDGTAITKQKAFGVLEGDFGAGNAALGSFTGLTIVEGGTADLEITAGSLVCVDAGDGTRNLNLSVTVRNKGRGGAAGTLRVEELINGIGTVAQSTAISLAPGAQTVFTNSGNPVLTNLTPNSVCCADIRINGDGAIKELNTADDTLKGISFTCP